MKLYVGNLSADTGEEEVRALFTGQGNITAVHMPADRETGRRRGYAFVTMDSAEAMNKAIQMLHGKEQWNGRILQVREASTC